MDLELRAGRPPVLESDAGHGSGVTGAAVAPAVPAARTAGKPYFHDHEEKASSAHAFSS
jgi:hypothetical protein